MSLCRGDGNFLQCGGNKVGESFGLRMSKLIAGSQYSLGLLFEILLNLDQDVKVNEPGCLMQATSPIEIGDLEECVSKIQTYLNSTA